MNNPLTAFRCPKGLLDRFRKRAACFDGDVSSAIRGFMRLCSDGARDDWLRACLSKEREASDARRVAIERARGI